MVETLLNRKDKCSGAQFVLRAESPRDYVDLLLSMKHQPNVIITDMPQMVAAHGNKRQPRMLAPFNGMTVGNRKHTGSK